MRVLWNKVLSVLERWKAAGCKLHVTSTLPNLRGDFEAVVKDVLQGPAIVVLWKIPAQPGPAVEVSIRLRGVELPEFDLGAADFNPDDPESFLLVRLPTGVVTFGKLRRGEASSTRL